MEALMQRWYAAEDDHMTLDDHAAAQRQQYPRVTKHTNDPWADLYTVHHSENPHGFIVNPLSPIDQAHIWIALREVLAKRGWRYRIESGYFYDPETPTVAFINPLMEGDTPRSRGEGTHDLEALLAAYVHALEAQKATRL